MNGDQWSEPEEIFERWLFELEEGEPEAFSAVLTRHPEHRRPLQQLREQWRRLRLVREHVVEGAPENVGSSGEEGVSFRGPRSLGSPAAVVAPGARIGRYQLVRELGRGGMGVVWEGRDLVLAEGVALKFLPHVLGSDRVAMLRMRREARVLLSLTHERIVRLRNIESAEGLTFLVEELLGGPDLQDVLAQRIRAGRAGLDASEALWLLEQAAPALDHAHAAGVTHRDIKPSNLLLDRIPQQGPDARLGERGECLKVADFGLAFVATSALSRVSSFRPSGTLPFMAPEILAGRKPSPAADVYGMGATLYALVTGDPPFQHGDIAMQVLHREPEPLDSGDRRLDAAVMAALSKDPTQRPHSLGELLDLARGTRSVARTKRGGRRTLAGLLLLAALTVVVALAAHWFGRGEEEPGGEVAVVDEGDLKSDPALQLSSAGEMLTIDFEPPFDAAAVHVREGVPLELAGRVREGVATAFELQVDSSIDALTTDSAGAFRMPLPLLAPGTHVLRLLNQGAVLREVDVVVDDAPPLLSLFEDGAAVESTRQAQVDLELEAQDQYLLAVRFLERALPRSESGRFLATGIPLEPGANELLFEASDRAGNRTTLALTITRRVDLPELVSALPEPGSFVNFLEPTVIELHFDQALSACSFEGATMDLASDGLSARGTWQPDRDGRLQVRWRASSQYGLDAEGSLPYRVKAIGIAPEVEGAAFEVVDDEACWDGWARRVRDPRTGVVFRLVNPGSTRVGVAPFSSPSIATPRLEARLSEAFYLAETELTVQQFLPFIQETSFLTDAERKGRGWVSGYEVEGASWSKPTGGRSQAQSDHPVTQVSWFDASAYCAHFGYRLPTEIEWEHAARGGRDAQWWAADELAFEAERDAAREQAEIRPAISDPGAFADMIGNVWEWCADGFDPLRYRDWAGGAPELGLESTPPAIVHDPVNSVDDPAHPRVLRGGSWSSHATRLSPAWRGWDFPSIGSSTRGFRPALDPGGLARAERVEPNFQVAETVALGHGDRTGAVGWKRDAEGMPRLHGSYSVSWRSGLRETGAFADGERVDRWQVETRSGDRLVAGLYANDRPARTWRFSREDGREAVISFKNGRPSGRYDRIEPGVDEGEEKKARVEFHSTARAIGALADGRREGPWVDLWPGGQVWIVSHYERGRRSGSVRAYGPDGVFLPRFLSGHYVDGRRVTVGTASWTPESSGFTGTEDQWGVQDQSWSAGAAAGGEEAAALLALAELESDEEGGAAAEAERLVGALPRSRVVPTILEAICALELEHGDQVAHGELLLGLLARYTSGRRPAWEQDLGSNARASNRMVQRELLSLLQMTNEVAGYWSLETARPITVIPGAREGDRASSTLLLQPSAWEQPVLHDPLWVLTGKRRRGSATGADEALMHALDWLAAHQRSDGSWSPADFDSDCSECGGAGLPTHHVGVTALATAAFLRSRDRAGFEKYEETVYAGLTWLLAVQDTSTGRIGAQNVWGPLTGTAQDAPKLGLPQPGPIQCGSCGGRGFRGDLGTVRPCEACRGSGLNPRARPVEPPPLPAGVDVPDGFTGHSPIVDQALASIVLAEAYAWTGSEGLRIALENAVQWIASTRNPYGAWRYDTPPVGDNDSHVTAWCALALVAAREVGVSIDPDALVGATNWFDEVTDPQTGRTGYTRLGSLSARSTDNDHFPVEKGEALSAAAMLIRSLLSKELPRSAQIEAHEQLILRIFPEWDAEGFGCDMLYWFFGAESMRLRSSAAVKSWIAQLERTLTGSQRKDGAAAGSWDPIGPWGYVGGRTYSTAINALSLSAVSR